MAAIVFVSLQWWLTHNTARRWLSSHLWSLFTHSPSWHWQIFTEWLSCSRCVHMCAGACVLSWMHSMAWKLKGRFSVWDFWPSDLQRGQQSNAHNLTPALSVHLFILSLTAALLHWLHSSWSKDEDQHTRMNEWERRGGKQSVCTAAGRRQAGRSFLRTSTPIG